MYVHSTVTVVRNGSCSNRMGSLRVVCVQGVLSVYRFELAGVPIPPHLYSILIYTLSSFFPLGLPRASEAFCMHRRSAWCILGRHPYLIIFQVQEIFYCNLPYLVINRFKNVIFPF